MLDVLVPVERDAVVRHLVVGLAEELLAARRPEQVESRLEETLKSAMDLSPRGIRQHLGLNKPIYTRTSSYGHFGREPDADGGFSWEKLDLVAKLQAAMA